MYRKGNGTPPGPGPKGNGKPPPPENDCMQPKDLIERKTGSYLDDEEHVKRGLTVQCSLDTMDNKVPYTRMMNRWMRMTLKVNNI